MNRNLMVAALLIVVAVIAYLAGQHADSGTRSSTPPTATGNEREILYWAAPMDANYRRDEPGKSPMGMDLVPVFADQVDSAPGVVRIDPTVVNNLGVRTALAERGPLSRKIRTVGYVAYDEDTVQHLHSRVDGWVERLVTKSAGDRVTKGQQLFELYSPTLVNAQEEYIAALRSSNESLKRASRDRLISLGIPVSEIALLEKRRKSSQTVPIYAKSDGIIASLGVSEGMFITPKTEIMAVATLDRVWIVAEVFERQSAWVEPGQSATISLDFLPGKDLSGTVDYVYPVLDPVTRTLKVRFRFDNPGEMMRPNMYAQVEIDGRGFDSVVHVPKQAVIRGGSTNRVVVDLGDGRYQSKPVRIGIESGDRVAIRSGIRSGERIVTSAQFLIDSEANIDSALKRMGDRREESME